MLFTRLHEDTVTVLSKLGRSVNTQIYGREYSTQTGTILTARDEDRAVPLQWYGFVRFSILCWVGEHTNNMSGSIPVSGAVCRCYVWRSLRRMVSTTKRWFIAPQVQCEAQACIVLQRCLCAVPFLNIPWTMLYRKGYYCANNGSEVMMIDTYCGPRRVGFGGI